MIVNAAAASAAAQDAHGTGSCWAALLRGDEQLIALFEVLRPLALGLDPGPASHETAARGVAPSVAAGAAPSDAAGEGEGRGAGRENVAREAADAWKRAITPR